MAMRFFAGRHSPNVFPHDAYQTAVAAREVDMTPKTPSLFLAMALAAAGPALAQLVVTNQSKTGDDRMLTFAEGAKGNSAPTGSLPFDGFAGVDPVHYELYRRSTDRIDVFLNNAFQGYPLVRSIVGPATGSLGGGRVAIDLVHDEIVVANNQDHALLVFPRTASGDVAPLRRIQGPSTGLSRPVLVAVDGASGEIFVADQYPNPGAVRTFSRFANGNLAPKRILTGPKTRINVTNDMIFDPLRDELLLADDYGVVTAFARTAQGNVAPLRVLESHPQGIVQPWGLALLGASELVVSDDGGAEGHLDAAVLTFPRLATGSVAAKRRINGPATGLFYVGKPFVAHRPLTLRQGRFAIEATWRTQSGDIGGSTVGAFNAQTGVFWFFSRPNAEMIVKVIDGCAFNQRFWVFAAGLTDTAVELTVTDLATGKIRLYTNPQGKPFQPIQDTDAFATCSASFPASASAEAFAAAAVADEVAPEVATSPSKLGPCDPCLLQDRFEVTASFSANAASGEAKGYYYSDDTLLQSFFNPSNFETVVKVIDACALNNRYWVFAAGLTDVHVDLTVRDVESGVQKTYVNPAGQTFKPIQDTDAFATCP